LVGLFDTTMSRLRWPLRVWLSIAIRVLDSCLMDFELTDRGAFRLSARPDVIRSGCSIVYDKFHIIQHANDAVEEVRRAEFFRKGPKMRDLINENQTK
jgi:hypothetical protein